MVDTMFGALAQMLPERVGAAGDGGNIGVSIGGWTVEPPIQTSGPVGPPVIGGGSAEPPIQTSGPVGPPVIGGARKPFIYVDFTCSAWGGRPFADGCDGNSHMFANMASPSIEVTESEQPIQIVEYEFLPDTMGAGEYRGGAPFSRSYRFLEDEGVLQVRADRRTHRPFGLLGGQAGAPSMNWLTRDGVTEALPSKFCINLRRGDVFRLDVPGGGGWGDPLARPAALVAVDVRNALVSPERARLDYGVLVTAAGLVDEPGTLALREKMRATRGPLAAIARGVAA
jgi:N-methylhydantoinase B